MLIISKKYNYLMNRKEYINSINDPDVYNYQKMLYNLNEGDLYEQI